MPEPWATRLVLEGGGHVLVNEADLWPDGQFVTTHLIVATGFLDEHPDVVKDLIAGLVDSIDTINADPDGCPDGDERRHRGDHDQPPRRRDDRRRLREPDVHVDPIASSLQESADDAIAVGLLEQVDLDGIYDLTLLNEVLAERGDDPVSDELAPVATTATTDRMTTEG